MASHRRWHKPKGEATNNSIAVSSPDSSPASSASSASISSSTVTQDSRQMGDSQINITKSSTNSNISSTTYNCPVCRKKFVRISAMKKHIEDKHPKLVGDAFGSAGVPISASKSCLSANAPSAFSGAAATAEALAIAPTAASDLQRHFVAPASGAREEGTFPMLPPEIPKSLVIDESRNRPSAAQTSASTSTHSKSVFSTSNSSTRPLASTSVPNSQRSTSPLGNHSSRSQSSSFSPSRSRHPRSPTPPSSPVRDRGRSPVKDQSRRSPYSSTSPNRDKRQKSPALIPGSPHKRQTSSPDRSSRSPKPYPSMSPSKERRQKSPMPQTPVKDATRSSVAFSFRKSHLSIGHENDSGSKVDRNKEEIDAFQSHCRLLHLANAAAAAAVSQPANTM